MDIALLLLCAKIFICRIVDVSFSTIRTILSVKGKTLAATVIGFFEVLIWFLIVREALNTATDVMTLAVAYAGGFAAGTFIGGKLANRFIVGHITMQIITSKRDDTLLAAVREAGYAISVINVNGSDYGSEKYMLIAEMKSSQQNGFRSLLHTLDPNAFVIVNETKYVVGGFGAVKKK